MALKCTIKRNFTLRKNILRFLKKGQRIFTQTICNANREKKNERSSLELNGPIRGTNYKVAIICTTLRRSTITIYI